VAVLARDSRLLGIAKDVLGSEAFPFRATLFDKSPGSNWLVVWHQDTALPLRNKQEAQGWGPWSVTDGIIYAHAPADALSQVLALRVHLDDSTEQNGPLRVLPRHSYARRLDRRRNPPALDTSIGGQLSGSEGRSRGD
jgi:Phytanoyl-CoA dioxygenase (PhyH)